MILSFFRTLTEIFPFSYKAHQQLFRLFFESGRDYPVYDHAIIGGILFAVSMIYAKDLLAILKEVPQLLKWPFLKNRNTLFLKYPYALLFCYLLISTGVALALQKALGDAGKVVIQWPLAIGIFWFVMGMLVFMSRHLANGSRNIYEMNHQDAFTIGLVQGLALFPGLSPIGLALLTAFALGIERREAARYCFLSLLPLNLIALFSHWGGEEPRLYDTNWTLIFITLGASAALSLVFLAAVRRLIKNGIWYRVGYYPIALGIFMIFHSLIQLMFY